MIVLIVEHIGLTVSELERQAPVTVDPNGPAPSILSLQGMQSEPRYVHIFQLLRGIKRYQQHAQELDVLELNASLGPGLKESAQALVPE